MITGDLTYSDDLPTLAKNADFMIIDSGGMVMEDGRQKNKGKAGNKSTKNKDSSNRKKKGNAHLNLAESSSMAKQANVQNLVYTHFNSTIVDTAASLKEIQKNYRGNVIFAEDLMVVNKEATKTSATRSSSAITSALPIIENSYAIVDSGQRISYSNNSAISLPKQGDDFSVKMLVILLTHLLTPTIKMAQLQIT
ncbi:hypothetical protein ACPUVO_15145 [Pseudocolwellia sp. HL-MZ19]|uniref:hypothetical protein n=1 Tax=unclassified Pseudocolwellia TaxID=2848178 RepID=UPI003CF5095B